MVKLGWLPLLYCHNMKWPGPYHSKAMDLIHPIFIRQVPQKLLRNSALLSMRLKHQTSGCVKWSKCRSCSNIVCHTAIACSRIPPLRLPTVPAVCTTKIVQGPFCSGQLERSHLGEEIKNTILLDEVIKMSYSVYIHMWYAMIWYDMIYDIWYVYIYYIYIHIQFWNI